MAPAARGCAELLPSRRMASSGAGDTESSSSTGHAAPVPHSCTELPLPHLAPSRIPQSTGEQDLHPEQPLPSPMGGQQGTEGGSR